MILPYISDIVIGVISLDYQIFDTIAFNIKYMLLYGRGVPLGHIGTRVALSAQGPIRLTSANMT